MKVAFVTWKFPALSNTFILNEIVEVLKRGMEVAIYSLERSTDPVVHQDVVEHSLLDRTRYLDDLIPPGRDGAAEFSRYSEDWLGDRVRSFRAVADDLVRTGVDVVHGCFANNSATVAMLVARLARLPFTFECHAHDLFVDLRYADEKIEAARRVFSISHYNREHLVRELGCDPAKVVIRRVPILKQFCDAIDRGERERGLVVSVARLHEIKGFDLSLDAMARIATAVPFAKLVIVGEGELRGQLEQQCRRLGLGERVRFAGTMTNQETLRLVRRAAAFVLPSRIGADGDRDGIPTSMIESMYLRTPTVSTRVSGIPELVDDGVDGFLVEPEDVVALADRLQRLLLDDELRVAMGERARQKVLADFDVDRNIDVMLAHWRAICREPVPAAPRRGFWSRMRKLISG